MAQDPKDLSSTLDFHTEKKPPKPIFHCNSHVGKTGGNSLQNFKTHFRMEYPSINLPTNAR